MKDGQPNDLERMRNTLDRYVKRQGRRLDPDGIYCKKHALQLKASLEKRAAGPQYSLGKVTKLDKQGPDLRHASGGIYNFHYLVEAIVGDASYVLDPLLRRIVPKSNYISDAYKNSEQATWDKS